MVLLGYKTNWREDAEGAETYFDIVNFAFDSHLSLAILRYLAELVFMDRIELKLLNMYI